MVERNGQRLVLMDRSLPVGVRGDDGVVHQMGPPPPDWLMAQGRYSVVFSHTPLYVTSDLDLAEVFFEKAEAQWAAI